MKGNFRVLLVELDTGNVLIDGEFDSLDYKYGQIYDQDSGIIGRSLTIKAEISFEEKPNDLSK